MLDFTVFETNTYIDVKKTTQNILNSPHVSWIMVTKFNKNILLILNQTFNITSSQWGATKFHTVLFMKDMRLIPYYNDPMRF